MNLSAYYNQVGNAEAALEYARKALEINPKSDRGLFQIAKAQERRGHLAAAAESLKDAISINSRFSSYYYVLATVYRRLGKTDESSKAFETFRILERDSSEIDRKKRDVAREDPVSFAARPGGTIVK